MPEKVFIFLELCEGGDLKQLMGQKKTIPEKEVISYLHQITSAFQTMYSNNIIHRDLKPANILISKGNHYKNEFFLHYYRKKKKVKIIN
jgi:serine/threonine protein kinase